MAKRYWQADNYVPRTRGRSVRSGPVPAIVLPPLIPAIPEPFPNLEELDMAICPHLGTQPHTALQSHGLTSQQASALMSLPNIDAGTVLTWIHSHGPAAVTLLKLILPSLVSDPALLALLMTILNTAGKTPAPAA